MRMAIIKAIVVAAALLRQSRPFGPRFAFSPAPAERSDRFSTCSIGCANPASGW